jgi:hypothetical protein
MDQLTCGTRYIKIEQKIQEIIQYLKNSIINISHISFNRSITCSIFYINLNFESCLHRKEGCLLNPN